MAKLKSRSEKFIELTERDYKILPENTIKIKASKIAGVEKMVIHKVMEDILLIQPFSRNIDQFFAVCATLIYVCVEGGATLHCYKRAENNFDFYPFSFQPNCKTNNQ